METLTTPRFFARLAAMVTLLLTLACGNVWATPTQTYNLTGYSSAISNGTCTEIGGAYVGRRGSGVTPDATYGVPTGGGNIAVVFSVGQTSTITMIVQNRQTSAKSGTINLAAVSNDYYTACVGGTLGAFPSVGQTCTITYAKNGSQNEEEFSFAASVSAGKYVLWTAGTIASNIYIKRVEINAAAACTAPDHVNVTGRWDRFAGETINLTATAYDGSDAEIAAANITGYQWQKLEGSTWTNVSNGTVSGATTTGATAKNLQITNCGAGNSGKYRCVVSTGATCSTPSATATDGSQGFGVKVYVLECYNDGTKTCSFTRTGDTQAGTATLTLAANTAYTFKFHVDNTYYGNNASIHQDITNYVFCNSDNGGDCVSNFTVNSGLGGTFTFGIEYSTGGNSSVEGEPELSVTYPRKTMYLVPNSDWTSNSAKFAFYYYGTSGTGWTDFLSSNECGMSADIPQWNGLNVIAVRFNPSDATPGWNGDGHVWNQTGDITATADKNCVTITDWNTGTYGTYSTPTYTISYNAGTGGSGSKSNETKTCGVDFTLPSSAVFTRTGYTQTGWTTSDGAAQTHALGGSYTTNAAQTFYPVWTVNQYTVTHTLDGVTKSSGATGANAATYGTNYTAEFAASSGYALPETITVTIGGSTKTAGTEYTWNQGTGTVTITGSYITGNIVITVNGESDSPCVIPSALTNEIARFQVPCDVDRSTTYNVTNEPYGSTNTYTTASFGGSSNWYYDETTGLSYGKMTSSSGLTITIKLNTGNFQAGDVVYVYANRDQTGKQGVKLHSSSGNTISVGSTASGVEASGSRTLVAADIEDDGSLKFYREGSNSFINRIIVTRPACTNVSITTQPTTPVAATVGSACSISGLVAAGTSPTYKWYTCNSDGSGATEITSAGAMSFTGYTSATLGLTPTAAGATYYKCVVSGSCGDPVTSSVVTVNASAAPASALVTYALNVGTDASTSIGTSGTSTDPTNITSIAISQANAAGDGAGASNRTTKLPLETGENAASVDDPDKYVLFTFNVACGKKLTPSEVKIKVANVGSSAGDNQNYKAVLSDAYGHSISNTFTGTKSDGTVEEFSITNGGGTYFQGDVTLKLWSCKGASGNASAFRMGTPVEIYGAIGNQATPAATITWNTQPANGRVGDPDFAYDVICSDGSTVTVTSANTTYATIVGGKLHYAAAGTTHLVATATDACGNVVVQNSSDFTVSAAAPTYSVTHSLTNVTATSGATGASAATEGVAYNAVFAANTGYVLPSTITVTIGGSPATAGTGYTWNSSTGAFQVPASQVTGAIVITIAGETAPATKDIYYGAITITAGALTKGSTGTVQFFTNTGGTIANNTEISLSTTLGAGSEYYLSNDLTGAELSKSSNWTTSSSSNRYVQGVKFGSGKSYTLALGSKVASSITFYGINGSASKTMTIGGQAWTSSSTKNTFAKHQFTKSGNFTGNVTIAQDGDFYGILVITIQTATPCTTPELSGLSDKNQCPGDNPTAWTVTVDNAATITAAGESIAYSWKKKGNDTELATTASFDVSDDVTEGQAGTYVVTVTVSAAGKASSSASAEVDLNVTTAVETPSISSNKATVYAGNSVTLTATCGTAGVTWNWYKCENSDGTGAGSSLATTAAYTFTAPEVGTHYYKATASTSGTCASSASAVYTLTVSAASECENYYWFIYADDATANGVINNRDGFFSNTSTGTGNTGSYTMTVDGVSMTGTKRLSTGAYKPKFTVPAGATATLYIYGKAASSDAGKHLVLKRTSDDEEVEVTSNTTVQGYTKENIEAGEWTLSCGSSNWCYSFFAVKVCSTSSCTDATPTIAAVNNTVCSGTKMRIDATGYEAGATFKWQKLNGSTWDDVTGETKDSLVIASVTVSNAGSYRFIATKGCARTSNTVTIAVPSAPDFGSTVPASVTVMQTIALSISTVEATDAVSYKWYKSANSSLEAGDPEIGSSKELMKAYADEAIGTPSYYVFCVATNSCGADTTSAIAVNVTAYVEQDCAVVGSSGEHNTFGKTGSVSSGTYGGVTELHTNSNNKYIYYTAEDGYYFSKAIVNACVGNASDLPTASYSYSTDGGENWTDANLTGMTTDYQNHIINLQASVNAFRVGRRLGDTGTSSSTIYIHKVCFEYTENCTATTITVSSSSVDYEMGDEWSNPTFTLSVAGTLTYSSSNEDIASVDDDGTVTFNGEAGTVTITASYAGGTISATEYCASSSSYTITVSCSSERPKIVPGGTVNMSGCNPSVALNAKMQDGTSDFSPAGTYQWYRDGEAISGATSASYTARQAGIYTVERTYDGCTNVSSNNATITSERVEPEIKHLVPFQYYHVDSIYHETSIMRYRHLFTVKASEEYNSTGRNFKMELSKNGSTPEDKTTSNAFVVKKSADNTVDTVLIDLNKLSGKFAEGDELKFTCKAVDCAHNVSEVYKDSITMHVIDKTPTMALILAGKDGGALNEYEPKNLQKQTGEKTWSGEWPLYTEMKKQYIITPLNGYAPFNKLNYEQYDIIFLTDFPKKSKNATAINNLADLVDYRPMFTFKTHMSGLSKWATKGFTEDPKVPKQSRLRLNIVCYAHPMFEELQTPSIKNQMLRDASDNTQLVYTLLTEGGYEKIGDVKKGIQGFDFSASDNFVTIGLIHYDATAADSVPDNEHVTWAPASADKTLVAAAERQYNPEARMVMFSLNAGAHSKLTETGQNVVLACLEYLLQDVMIKPMADCAYTFDNDEGRGNGKWSVATNWLQEELPGPYQAVKVIAPATVDYPNAKALEVRLIDDGKITIAKNGVLTVQSTIRRKDGSETLPTEEDDIVIETAADGQGALIFNNDRGDSRATVNLYSKGRKDGNNYQFQYIAMPMGRVPVHPYFEGSDIFTYAYTEAGGWERRGYYTDLYAFEGIGVTTRRATASNYTIKGALTSTESQSLDMTYENSIATDKGYNMFGNSWSAPIQISQLRVGNEDANIQKTVYIYVAGKDPDGGPTTSGDKTEVAGKWLAIPFDASGFEGWTGLKVIPAFQAFEIQTNAAATLSLDYDKMVRGGTTEMNEYLRAPKRRTAEHEGIELMVLHLAGGKVNNDLFMFEGEQFSDEFDNGWEATFKEDEEIPTQLYSPTPVGKLAVAALPSLEGAKVNFTTNETGEYTFTFSGAGNAYYLNDIKEQKSALIKEGNAYVFALEEGDAPDRFYISHTPLGAPAIATGVDEVDSEALKVRKIIHNDQLYIIRGGQLYDATGKVVK